MTSILTNKLKNLSKWDKVYLVCMALSLTSALTEISGIQDLNCGKKDNFKKKLFFSKSIYFTTLMMSY